MRKGYNIQGKSADHPLMARGGSIGNIMVGGAVFVVQTCLFFIPRLAVHAIDHCEAALIFTFEKSMMKVACLNFFFGCNGKDGLLWKNS